MLMIINAFHFIGVLVLGPKYLANEILLEGFERKVLFLSLSKTNTASKYTSKF